MIWANADSLIYNSRNFKGRLDGTAKEGLFTSTTVEILKVV